MIATVVGLPLSCVLVIIPLWFVVEFDGGIWALIVPTSLYVLILLGGGFGGFAWVLQRRKRRLDAAFTPLGLEGERYLLTGRRYQGTVEGRRVDVRFYRGPMLELHVSTPLQTRFGVAEKGSTTLPLARLFGREPVDLDYPELRGLHVFALDEDWARSLLANPEARMVVRRLLQAGQSWALIQQVVLGPGAFRLRLYRNKHLFKYEITSEETRRWFDDLLVLARAAESLPAPTVTAEESSAERLVRSGGAGRIGLIIVAVLVGIPACLMTLAAAVFFIWTVR
jgi:hypothetical protein